MTIASLERKLFMATTPGTLFDDRKTRVKRDVMRRIDSNKVAIDAYLKTLEEFSTQLSMCSTLSHLHYLTNQIIAKNDEISAFIRVDNKVNHPEIREAIIQAAPCTPYLANFVKLLGFYDDMAWAITQAKERITLDAILKPLSKSQKEDVLDTIYGIKSLYPVVDVIEAAKKTFQERLSLASSFEAVTCIEEEIEAQDDIYTQLYKATNQNKVPKVLS